MSSPEISVMIPVCNTGRILQETIDSVLAQSFEDFELIIIDDGSTDPETAAVLDRQNDSRIKIIRQENAGVAAARNHGLSLARGKYIAFLDHDDLFLPEKLMKSRQRFADHPDAVLVYSEIIPFGNFQNQVLKLKIAEGNIFHNILAANPVVSMSCVMVKREILELHNITFHDDCVPCDDWAFELDCSRYGGVYCTEKPVVKYRFHNGNQSAEQMKMYKAGLRVIKRYVDILPEISAGIGVPHHILRKNLRFIKFRHHYGLAWLYFQRRDLKCGIYALIGALADDPVMLVRKLTGFGLKKLF